MEKRLWLCAAAALLIAIGVGPVRASHHPNQPPVIVLNEDDSGTTVNAIRGQYINITLQDPWGGAYGWQLTEIRGDAVKYTGRTVRSPGIRSNSAQQGANSGVACFRLVAIRSGEATVSLVCAPPPGLMVPARLYQVTFVVPS